MLRIGTLARSAVLGLACGWFAATPTAPAQVQVGLPSIVRVHDGHGGAAQATGTVKSVDAGKRTVKLSHGAIKALGWPAMTMDFPLSPEADLASVRPGMRVTFTLIRISAGQYQVDTLKPADAAGGH